MLNRALREAGTTSSAESNGGRFSFRISHLFIVPLTGKIVLETVSSLTTKNVVEALSRFMLRWGP